jgi:3,4-dihydroxy 2-butanone 4-phosphate synthase/GTP cyclohydrolase II
MARRPELEDFAVKHNLKMGTIADLIEYRSLHEQSVELRDSKTIQTEFGEFQLHSFADTIDDTVHYALTKGEISEEDTIPVRVQTLSTLRDVFGTKIESERPGWTLRRAMERVANSEKGVVVLIGQELTPQQSLAELAQFPKTPSVYGPGESAGIRNYRVIGTGAQILKRLGVGKMQLMSVPIRFNALSGFNLEVTEFIHP